MTDSKAKAAPRGKSKVDISGLVALSSSDDSDVEIPKPVIAQDHILHTEDGKFMGIIDRKRHEPGKDEGKKRSKSPKKSKVKSVEYVDDSSNASSEIKKETSVNDSNKEALDSQLSSPKSKKKKKHKEKSASPARSPSKKVAKTSTQPDVGDVVESVGSPKAKLGKHKLPEWPSGRLQQLEMRLAGSGDVINSEGAFQPPMLSPEPKKKHKKPISPRPAGSPKPPKRIEIGPGGDAPSKLDSPKKKRKSDADSLLKDSPQKKKSKTAEPKIM